MSPLKNNFDPQSFLSTLTSEPGIYQMYDEHGTVLYVGKARHLKKRLSSYYSRQTQSPKTHSLLKKVANIEVTVTNSDNEALLLESNLIKKYKPRYNVLLRDDKSYPYIELSQHAFPRLDIHRGKKNPKSRYFGPFPSAYAVRESLNLLQKLFRIRQCSDSFFNSRTRPCLQYQIKRCTAPCVGYIDEGSYAESVNLAELFLAGKNQQIMDDLAQKMTTASDALNYEKAAIIRDQIQSLQAVQQQQYITTDGGDIDIVALATQANGVCIQVMTMRGGRIIGGKAHFPQVPAHSDTQEVLHAFLSQYYLNPVRAQSIPEEVILNKSLKESDWLVDYFKEQQNKKVTLKTHVRGQRLKWLTLAIKNATVALRSHLASRANQFQRLEALQQVLQLEAIPQRLECVDISHTMGEATVASIVVFNGEGPLKQDYRRFNIKDITPGDDYAAIKQALTRRYTRVKEKGGNLPDVLFIDGGKGQLHQAEAVLEELQVTGVLLIAIAKGRERQSGKETLWLSGRDTPLNIDSHSLAHHLIEHIRDEAHRFAITGHRQQRKKARTQSPLEGIAGVGPQRRRALLTHFGGLQAMKQASVEEIAKVQGISRTLAQSIFAALHG